jgi:hypothetical protein
MGDIMSVSVLVEDVRPLEVARTSPFRRNWRPAILIFGAIATIAWSALLGYGLVMIIARAI